MDRRRDAKKRECCQILCQCPV